MKWIGTSAVLVGVCLMISAYGGNIARAQQVNPVPEAVKPLEQATDSEPQPVKNLEQIVVTGKSGTPGLETSPSKTVIEVDDFSVIGPKSNIQDMLKTQRSWISAAIPIWCPIATP